MHLSLSFFCAILSFTKAQELPDSTSTSTNAAVPWITYTSTRLCTTQPSTVFVYTSNSTTFLLPQPGPNSAITPLDSNAVSYAYDTSVSAASNDGFAMGAEGTAQALSGDSGSFVSAIGSQGLPATPSNTVDTAQSTPWGMDSITVTPLGASAGSSTTSRRGLEAGFSAGNGPRSGTQDLLSTVSLNISTTSAPYLVTPGSTCPSPSTVTISAALPGASCASSEKTVTSYIMASCPATSGVLETQTIVQSGQTAYITRTRQMTRPIVITYTTIQSGTTAYRTSLEERSATPLPTTSPETTFPAMLTTIEGESGYCTSVLERTITIERTVENTVSLGVNSSKYATFTTLQNGTTVYLTSLIEATPNSISAGIPTVTLTLWNGSTIYRTSVIERTATAVATPAPSDPITITFTQSQNGSTVYQTSIVERTVLSAYSNPSIITFTLAEGGTTVYRTSTIERTPSAIFAEPSTVTFTCIKDGSTVYRTSVIRETASRDAVVYTTWEGQSTIYLTSVIPGTPSPMTVTYSNVQEATTIYRESVVERTAEPMTLTYTEVQEASTAYITSTIQQTPSPVTTTYTEVLGGSTFYGTVTSSLLRSQ